jgi:hypothetical protein
MRLGRARGLLLRLARRRLLSVGLGLALALPALWVEIGGRDGRWWIDGLSLILAATGAALAWSGLTGNRPDWIDEG